MKDRHDFKTLPFSDPFLFGMVMHDMGICKLFLEAVLEKDVGPLRFIDEAEGLCGPIGAHSHGLGVYLAGRNGARYYIALGSTVEDTPRLHSNYNIAITRQLFQAETVYHEDVKDNWGPGLPDSLVILVNDCDVVGNGWPRYHVVRRIRGIASNGQVEQEFFDDGVQSIGLYTRYKEQADAPLPLLEFLDYFRDGDDTAPFTTPLAQAVVKRTQTIRQNKEVEEDYMTYEEKLNESYLHGAQAQFRRIVKHLSKTLPLEQMAELMGKSVKDIQTIVASPDGPDEAEAK